MLERVTLIVASACLAALAVAALAAGDLLGLSLALAALLLPILLFAVLRGTRGDSTYGPLLGVALLLAMCANFRYRAYGTTSIDLQVALKLMTILAFVALSLVSFRDLARVPHPRATALWVAFLGYMSLTALWAESPAQALVYSGSLVAGYLYLTHACLQYGPRRTSAMMVVTGALLCTASLVAYIAVPSFGRMSDWVGNAFVVTGRLQGVFGTSNGAGSSAAAALFLTLAIYARLPGSSRLLTALLVVTTTACVILSNNRMALLALLVAASVLFVLSGRFADRLLLLVAVGLLGVSALALFGDTILVSLSRSGSADEISSATGRTRIWAVVLELWRETPLFGRGFASSQHILPKHPALFLAAAHAHNVYLEILFTGGLVGLGLFLAALATTIQIAVKNGAAEGLALLSYFLVYGLTEPVIGGILGYVTLTLFLVVTLIHMSPGAGYQTPASLTAPEPSA